MKSFITRALSALVAIVGLILIYKYFGATGFVFLCFLVTLVAERELIQILFKVKDSKILKVLFFIFTLAIFYFVLFSNKSSQIFALLACLYCSVAIVILERENDLNMTAQIIAKSVMGFFYLGFLPALTCQIIYMPNGMTWFFTLLAIVFAGDTFAYLSGIAFGKHKIMPTISPKKTVEGSIGGLVGSVCAALVSYQFLPHVPAWHFIVIGLSVGIFAQLGDFFESLLKRIANIKDSGVIMPGHGGVLDRLDGVLFAAPFMNLIAYVYEYSLDKVM